MGFVDYSPLAQGIVTGKYVDEEKRKWKVLALSRASYMKWIAEKYFTNSMLDFMLKFMEFVRQKGMTPAQLALAWTLNMEKLLGITVILIVSISKLSHLEEAIEASEISLSMEDLKYLNEISENVKLGS